jgi:hypothetical protein
MTLADTRTPPATIMNPFIAEQIVSAAPWGCRRLHKQASKEMQSPQERRTCPHKTTSEKIE